MDGNKSGKVFVTYEMVKGNCIVSRTISLKPSQDESVVVLQGHVSYKAECSLPCTGLYFRRSGKRGTGHIKKFLSVGGRVYRQSCPRLIYGSLGEAYIGAFVLQLPYFTVSDPRFS